MPFIYTFNPAMVYSLLLFILYVLIVQNGSEYSWVQDWTQLHVARIRDIELLTGLSFYPDLLPIEDALQLKTFLKSF